MFHVGQHVVCVDDKNWGVPGYGGDAGPVKGNVYTIYAVTKVGSVAAVQLEEKRAAIRWGGWYKASRFRPLSPTRLDVFRQLLVSSKERVDE